MLRSPPRLGRKTLLLLPSLIVAGALSACAGPTAIFLNADPCSGLVPKELTDPTPGADLPADDSQGSWVKFGDAQTGQLDKANLKGDASMKIIKACEARDAAAANKLQPRPWWKLWGH